MGTLVGYVASRTNPKTKHEIRIGKDGIYYCDCWVWKKRRTCPHVDSFMNSEFKCEFKEMKIDQIVEREIKRLRR